MSQQTKSPLTAQQNNINDKPSETNVELPQGLTPVPVIPEQAPEEDEGSRFNPNVAQSIDMRRYTTALAVAQGMIKNALKRSKNDHFKTSYADLAEVADACRTALSSVQISWEQIPMFTEQEIWLQTILTHGPSGQYRAGRWPIPKSAMNKSQDLMAAFTYGRRGSLAMMAGVVSENDDDDGNATQDMDDGTNQDKREAPRDSKILSEAKQWVPFAIRRIGLFKTLAELNDWEEKNSANLVGLKRIYEAGHIDVMKAIQDAGEKLAING